MAGGSKRKPAVGSKPTEKRESGRWRPVYYQNGYYYVFEIRGGKLLLSKRPNDTLWVHKVDPSDVEFLPWYGDSE